MARFWRNFRLGLLVIMFIATGLYLMATFPITRFFSKPPTHAALIQEGEAIVDAIYKFRAERGLWPQYLDDVYPAYATTRPASRWNYEVLPGGPSLATPLNSQNDLLGYDFDPSSPVWRAVEGYETRVIKKGAVPRVTTLPAQTLLDNKLKELDRRIVNDRGWMPLYRAKASVLLDAGRLEDARATIAAAKASDDEHFWPRLAEAAIHLEKPATSAPAASAPATASDAGTSASAPGSGLPEAATRFEQWVRAQPTFTRLYYLSVLYRMAGRNAEALGAVEQALNQPVQVSEDDDSPPAFYLWDMGRLALQQRQFDLVIRITTAWEKMQSDRRREENSFLPLMAAAKLAKGDVGGADTELKKFEARKAPSWAKNTKALRDAIDRKDTGFRYDPGSNPLMYQVFELPE